MQKTIDTLLDAMVELTRGDEPYADKAAAVRKAASANEELSTALDEFLSWFND